MDPHPEAWSRKFPGRTDGSEDTDGYLGRESAVRGDTAFEPSVGTPRPGDRTPEMWTANIIGRSGLA
jgi:hypothetical protein